MEKELTKKRNSAREKADLVNKGQAELVRFHGSVDKQHANGGRGRPKSMNHLQPWKIWAKLWRTRIGFVKPASKSRLRRDALSFIRLRG